MVHLPDPLPCRPCIDTNDWRDHSSDLYEDQAAFSVRSVEGHEQINQNFYAGVRMSCLPREITLNGFMRHSMHSRHF